jgi:hypothetical protein
VDAEDAVGEGLGDRDGVGFEIALERGCVASGEGDGGEAGCGCGRWDRFDFKPLEIVDGVAGDAFVLCVAEAEGLAVEVGGGGGIGGVDAHECDAGDGGPLLGVGKTGGCKEEGEGCSSHGDHSSGGVVRLSKR